MLKLNWKKGMAAVLAGIMSFGVLSTTLAVPAEAAAHHYEDSNWHSHHDRQVHEAHERLEREHRRTEKSSKGHSTGEVTTAAILGAVVGAVIAKNT